MIAFPFLIFLALTLTLDDAFFRCLEPKLEWVLGTLIFFIIFCIDLLFIRYVLGQSPWNKWQTYWGNKTHWRRAVGITLFVSAMVAFPNIMAQTEISEHFRTLYVFTVVAGWLTFIYIFCIFRDQPTRLRGIITYGALLITILCAWILSF